METGGQVAVYLCAVLLAVAAINVQTPDKVVKAPRGGSAKLQCSYTTDAPDRNSANIIWQKLPEEAEAIAMFFGVSNSSDPAYQGRVSFTGNFYSGDASILIDKLTMDDNGTYQCEVNIPKDRAGVRQSKMELLVLVPPSKPDCGIVGTAEYGQVIKLTCRSQEGSPAPQYTWKSYTPQDVPRAVPPTAVIEGGELTLKNVSMETSGFYVCTSTNTIGENFCNLTLAVMPPSMNIALYAGAIGGSLAGIIVIGVIAYCCCCRNRDEKENYEMADREEEEGPDPPPKKRHAEQQQHHYQDEAGEDEFEEDDDDQRRPPMIPPNKPRLVVDA